MTSSTLRRSAHATLSTLSTIPSHLKTLPTTVSQTIVSLPHQYSTLVASNAQSISTIESSLRSLSYLLPGARLADSELASESLHTFIQLLSLYHDDLLKKRAAAAVYLNSNIGLSKASAYGSPRPSVPKAPHKPSLHYKYLSYLTSSYPPPSSTPVTSFSVKPSQPPSSTTTADTSLYTPLAHILKIIEYTQLLWEMLARRSSGGEKSRWRIVVLLETFKAICRLALVRVSGGRMLMSSVLPVREDFAPASTEDSEDGNLLGEETEMVEGDDLVFGTTKKEQQEAEEEEAELSRMTDAMKESHPFNTSTSSEAQHTLFQRGVPTPPLSDSGHPSPPSKSKSHLSPPPSQTLPNHSHPQLLPRTSLTLPPLPLPTQNSIQSFLSAHILKPHDLLPPSSLLPPLTNLASLSGEIIYILRPLIYAILMQRLASKYGYVGTRYRKIWTPFILSLILEVSALKLQALGREQRSSSSSAASSSTWISGSGSRTGPPPTTNTGLGGVSGVGGVSDLENQESQTRLISLSRNFLRGAFYQNVTKGYIQGAAGLVRRRVPVVGELVAGVVEDYEGLWGEWIFGAGGA